MTTPATNPNPSLDEAITGYDPTGHQTNIALQVGTVTQDSTTGIYYASLQSTVGNANANGQTTMANSSPVVLASDEIVPVKRSTVAVYSLASTAITTTPLNSGDLTVGPYTEISIDINATAHTGTNPTIQFTYSRKAADGIYYALWQSAVLSTATFTVSTSIGTGMAYNQSLGVTGQLSWVIGGSATPGQTFSVNIQGK
jgi:hypothetical protein